MERQQGSPGPHLLLLHQALTSDPSVSPSFFLQYAGNTRHDTHPLIRALHLESYGNKGIIDSEGLLQLQNISTKKNLYGFKGLDSLKSSMDMHHLGAKLLWVVY